MVSRFQALGLLLVLAFVSCKPKKSLFAPPTDPEAVVTSDAVRETPTPVPTPEPIPDQTPTPVPTSEPIPDQTPASQPPPIVERPCEGTPLVIATDKLGTGPLKAQIEFNGTLQELMFTPGPKFSTLCLKGLTETEGSLLTLLLLRNDQVRFIAKRANTVYRLFTPSSITIENCLILPVPWDGLNHEGSCEWSITELPHDAY